MINQQEIEKLLEQVESLEESLQRAEDGHKYLLEKLKEEKAQFGQKFITLFGASYL